MYQLIHIFLQIMDIIENHLQDYGKNLLKLIPVNLFTVEMRLVEKMILLLQI